MKKYCLQLQQSNKKKTSATDVINPFACGEIFFFFAISFSCSKKPKSEEVESSKQSIKKKMVCI
jgi:hypothetical protein